MCLCWVPYKIYLDDPKICYSAFTCSWNCHVDWINVHHHKLDQQLFRSVQQYRSKSSQYDISINVYTRNQEGQCNLPLISLKYSVSDNCNADMSSQKDFPDSQIETAQTCWDMALFLGNISVTTHWSIFGFCLFGWIWSVDIYFFYFYECFACWM